MSKYPFQIYIYFLKKPISFHRFVYKKKKEKADAWIIKCRSPTPSLFKNPNFLIFITLTVLSMYYRLFSDQRIIQKGSSWLTCLHVLEAHFHPMICCMVTTCIKFLQQLQEREKEKGKFLGLWLYVYILHDMIKCVKKRSTKQVPHL